MKATVVIKQGWLRAAIFVVVFFSCAVLAGEATGYVIHMPAGPLTGISALNGSILLLVIISIISIVLTVIFCRFIDRRPVTQPAFTRAGYLHHGYTGFCLGLALPAISTLILFLNNNLQWTGTSLHAGDIFIALVLMGIIALAEEMVFRGYVLHNLMQSMNKLTALGISALLFALAHSGNPGITIIAAVNLFAGGLLLGINYIYTRNLWFAILFHGSWNFFQGPVAGYGVSGLPLQSILQPQLSGPWWLTGGRFGLEGSIIITPLFIAALILLYAIYERKPNNQLAVNP